MQLTLVLTVDSEDEPNQVLSEVVSALEFDHRTTVNSAFAIEGSNDTYRCEEKTNMTVKIIRNDVGNPPGKLADAELRFTDGPLAGLKLIGFAVWERRGAPQRIVTFPARQYSVNGERRSFALLRPVVDIGAQDPIRDLILDAFAQNEECSRRD